MEEIIRGDDEHLWLSPGYLLTKGPGAYKIPSFNDVPENFSVTIMDKSNKRAVHSSKGIGEPPFFLGCTAFFAIREAIKAARKEFLETDDILIMNSPMTSERIRMACLDELSSNFFIDKNFQAKGSW